MVAIANVLGEELTDVKARFFKRANDGTWTMRTDTQSSMSTAEAEAHCAAEYGFAIVAEEVNLPAAAFEALKAQRRVGAIAPPVQAPAFDTPQQVAWKTAKAANDVAGMLRMLGKAAGFER